MLIEPGRGGRLIPESARLEISNRVNDVSRYIGRKVVKAGGVAEYHRKVTRDVPKEPRRLIYATALAAHPKEPSWRAGVTEAGLIIGYVWSSRLLKPSVREWLHDRDGREIVDRELKTSLTSLLTADRRSLADDGSALRGIIHAEDPSIYGYRAYSSLRESTRKTFAGDTVRDRSESDRLFRTAFSYTAALGLSWLNERALADTSVSNRIAQDEIALEARLLSLMPDNGLTTRNFDEISS